MNDRFEQERTMAAGQQREPRLQRGLRGRLLDIAWKTGFAIALVVAASAVAGTSHWSSLGAAIVLALGSLLSWRLQGRNHYRSAAWTFVLMTCIAVSLPLHSWGQSDLRSPAASAAWKALPLSFTPLVWLAGLLVNPSATLAVVGIQLVAALTTIFRGTGVEPLHVVALVSSGASVALVWAALPWYMRTKDREAVSRHQAAERAEELRLSADMLRQSRAARDLLEDQLTQASAERDRGAARLRAAADLSRCAIRAVDAEDLMRRFTRLIHDLLGVHAALFLMDATERWVVLRACSEASHLEGEVQLKVNDRTSVGWCAVHRRARFSVDVRNEATLLDHLLPRTRSEAVLPLLAGDDLVGVLSLQSTEVGAFTTDDATILGLVADQVAGAISRVRSHAEAEQAGASLSTLQGRYIAESWERFAPRLRASGYRWSGGQISSLGHRPLAQVSHAVSTGDTVKGAQDLTVPITLPGGQVIGALGLSEPGGTRQWTDDDVVLVESVARQLSMALENARLFQDAQERLAEITALQRHYLRESYGELVPSLPQTEYTFAQPGVSPEISLGEELEHVMADSEPVIVVRSVDASPESSLLAPIPLRNHVLGALGLQELGEGREWTEDDLALVDAVTEQMGIAIENARLFSETRQRATELSRVAEELRETDRFRSQFLANMSHELRTPLNSIIGFSRVILKGIDGPLTELQKTDLEAIHGNGQHLLRMITDILDVSKIQAGKMELVVENVDMNALVGGVLSTSAALARSGSVDFQIEIEPDLPTVRADGTRIRQVITNLVSNAVKFTLEGCITLRAWRSEGMVYVSVADTGDGIAEDKMPLVFEPFRQVDASSARRAGGTGLGLPISRQFIEMHGGQIWVDSELGVGSTFTFFIPIEGPVEDVQELASLDLDASRKVLLVIEHDESELPAYEQVLDGGYQLVGLYDGRDAVRWARYLRPWAILMDVHLRHDWGWRALELLRSTRGTRDVPVIVCSAEGKGGQAISMGAVAYLPKPIVGQELVEILERIQR